ncbi:MAG: ATP-binding protein [Firmicutes bacterium]|nr:ATP-binding protein [Bacillota bacterium]
MTEKIVNEQFVLFEENYLLRTLGPIASSSDIALTELVANAWDSGAQTVKITIPEASFGELVIEDDGTGLTQKQFMQRWMTLGYDRIKNQGLFVETPPGRDVLKARRAYGRNGIGRHGMLCFGDRYYVETSRDGKGYRFLVTASSGKEPFKLIETEEFMSTTHGTKLRVKVERNLSDIDKIRDVLSARFLCDPEFHIIINGKSIPLEEHQGVINRKTLIVNENVKLDAFFIDSSKAARTARQHGVVFWVGKKSVGEPSWNLGEIVVLDGRRSVAKRYTVVIKTDDLYDEVLPDWTGFRRTPIMDEVYKVVRAYVENVIRELSRERISDMKKVILSSHQDELAKLSSFEQKEVVSFVDELVYEVPNANEDFVSAAVKAVINLEKSRSGAELLNKLSQMSLGDIEGLNNLLADWTVSDAILVLSEIDRRISVIEALGRLSSDPTIDELTTLHPLVTQARWLFGPEFDSPHYTSNRSLTNAAKKVFGNSAKEPNFINPRKRPDLVILADSSLSMVATEEFDTNGTLCRLKNILIIELKKGGFKITRKEMQQAEEYVEDLLNCGLIEGLPYFNAFVVGHEVKTKMTPIKKLGERPEFGRIEVCTFDQLIRTAEARLFNLRKNLSDRYEEMTNEIVMQKNLFN